MKKLKKERARRVTSMEGKSRGGLTVGSEQGMGQLHL